MAGAALFLLTAYDQTTISRGQIISCPQEQSQRGC
jgi:hypothetical protein